MTRKTNLKHQHYNRAKGGGLTDWSFVNGSFPRGMRPCDVDGMLEINGQFLVLEAKFEGELPLNPDSGQFRMYERLSRLPGFTVVVLVLESHGLPIEMTWGNAEHPLNLTRFRAVTTDDVRAFFKMWSAFAEGRSNMRLSA